MNEEHFKICKSEMIFWAMINRYENNKKHIWLQHYITQLKPLTFTAAVQLGGDGGV